MATTTKRISIALTKEDLREIEVLCDFFEETVSQVIKRAITVLHDRTFHPQEETKD